MRLMRNIFVDPTFLTVTVMPGANVRDVEAELGLHDLVLPLGWVQGVVFTMVFQSACSPASRVFGNIVSHLEEVTVVTSEGGVVLANRKQNEDLFWGVTQPGYSVILRKDVY